jgi:thiol-disulfide isomerase/thioredoxin
VKVLVAVAALVLLLAGCDSAPDSVTLGGALPGATSVQVDTPELQALRADTKMPDCAAGPGGGQLPELTLPCLGGGTSVDLSSLEGPMVLNFWGAWCGPCREEMPLLQQFHATYGTKVPVLGLDFQDRYPGNALKQIAKRGVTYPSLADPGGEVQETKEFSKVPGMPMTYLIDAQGKVAFVQVGQLHSEQQLVDLVRDHLGVDL